MGASSSQNETIQRTGKGLSIAIRPMEARDAFGLRELFNTLSERSIRQRFFGSKKKISEALVEQLTAESDDQVVLTAFEDKPLRENPRMIAVARVIKDSDGTAGEYDIIVGDPWQKKGVGKTLLAECFRIAKAQGVKTIRAEILRDNAPMLSVLNQLGIEFDKQVDADAYRVTIDLAASRIAH